MADLAKDQRYPLAQSGRRILRFTWVVLVLVLLTACSSGADESANEPTAGPLPGQPEESEAENEHAVGQLDPSLYTPPAGSFEGAPIFGAPSGLVDPRARDVRIMSPTPNRFWETTSVVVPRGGKGSAACPGGRVLVASGDDAGGVTAKPPVIILHDLGGDASAREITLPAPPADVSNATADNQFVRRADGEILLLWGGVRKNRPNGDSAETNFDYWKNLNEGRRGIFMIWRSNDCGNSWTNPEIVLDSAEVALPSARFPGKDEVGLCAWPTVQDRAGVNGWTLPAKHQFNGGGVWVGGYDRQEIYADPWDPNRLYLNTSCGGGAEPPADEKTLHPDWTSEKGKKLRTWLVAARNWQRVIFVSDDGGHSWRKPYVIPGEWTGVPVAMTSLPGPAPTRHGGPLFVFTCHGDAPVVGRGVVPASKSARSFDDMSFFSVNTKTDNPKPCAQAPRDDLPKADKTTHFGFGWVENFGIARAFKANLETIRIAFPSYSADIERTEAVTVEVNFSPSNGEFTTAAERVIDPGPGEHVVGIDVVESDRVDLSPDSTYDGAMFHWFQTKSGQYTERYALFNARSGTLQQTQDLAVNPDGSGRFWTPVIPGVGDYVKGAFAVEAEGGPPPRQTALFVAQWPEMGSDGMRIHYRIVAQPLGTIAPPANDTPGSSAPPIKIPEK